MVLEKECLHQVEEKFCHLEDLKVEARFQFLVNQDIRNK